MTENKELMELLKRARTCRYEIDAQLLHIERLHDVIDRTRDLTRVKIYTDRLRGLEVKINASINRAADAESEVQHLLNELNGTEKSVLYRYYILGEEWSDIAKNIYFSERSIYNIRKQALKKLSRIYERERKNEIRHNN